MWEKRVEPNSGTAHVAKCFPKIFRPSYGPEFSVIMFATTHFGKQPDLTFGV